MWITILKYYFKSVLSLFYHLNIIAKNVDNFLKYAFKCIFIDFFYMFYIVDNLWITCG